MIQDLLFQIQFMDQFFLYPLDSTDCMFMSSMKSSCI
ncbi:hypothetical protein TSAR_014709, partial (mitochondrion) [Trichomalopsis sarcophagae]